MDFGSRPFARQSASSTARLAGYSSRVMRVVFHSSAQAATIGSVRFSPRPPTIRGTRPPGGSG